MLSDLQRRVALVFFSVADAQDFALAGGAAMIEQGQIDRSTKDLDFFADSRNVKDVSAVVQAFERAATDHHLIVRHVQLGNDLRASRNHSRRRRVEPDNDRRSRH